MLQDLLLPEIQGLGLRRFASCAFPVHFEDVPRIEMRQLLLAKGHWLAARDILSNHQFDIQLLVSPDLTYT
jgi:hypothetical protein